MHLNLKPFGSYGWNLVVSNIWSWCFLKHLNETLRFKIWEIFNLHSLFQVCLFDKSQNYSFVVVVKINDSTFGLVGNQHLASLHECMKTFNIETNFAISLRWEGLANNIKNQHELDKSFEHEHFCCKYKLALQGYASWNFLSKIEQVGLFKQHEHTCIMTFTCISPNNEMYDIKKALELFVGHHGSVDCITRPWPKNLG
jgi:hypothetical protein